MRFNPRIFGAFLVGAGLIGAAYFFAPTNETTPVTDPTIAAVTANAPDRELITIKDSDNDGIPDWQEDFRTVEPIEIAETETTSVEDYTPPETLTGQLAIDLLTNTIRAEGYGPLGPTQEETLLNAAAKIEDAANDTLYTSRDIQISTESSIDTLRIYGNKIAAIVANNPLPPDTRAETDILQAAVYADDESVLAELTPIIKAYTGLRDDMLILSTPSVMAKEHLDLLNAYNALLLDIESMQLAFSDPMQTMVRTKRYYDDALALSNALNNLYTKLGNSGVVWDDSDIVTQIFTITE